MKDLNRLHDIEEEIMALLDEAVEDARLGSEEKIDLFFVIGSILDEQTDITYAVRRNRR